MLKYQSGVLGFQHSPYVDPSNKHLDLSRIVRKPDFSYAKTKAQISFAVTAKLISASVFTTRIVRFLFFLNPKFQASSLLLWLYRPVCVRPGRKPRRPVFLHHGSFICPYLIQNIFLHSSPEYRGQEVMHWPLDAMAEGVVYQFMPPLLDPEGINAQE